jgi:hypothetical protein
VNVISTYTYQFINNSPPPTGFTGSTQLATCDNGVWINRNVMNDYGVSVNQKMALGDVGGLSFTLQTETNGTSLGIGRGLVTGYTNVHILGNILKCQSNTAPPMMPGQNNKLIIRLNFVADSEVSGNNLIACNGGAVTGENLASWAYHVAIENNDFWNSEATGSACLLVAQQTGVTESASCPNLTCGSQGYVIRGNRFHNCTKADVYFTTSENPSVIADNDVSDNVGDDSGTGLNTYGFAFSNAGDGCNDNLTTPSGCNVMILRSHVHDNAWGGLPGKSSGPNNGNGVNIEIGPGGYPCANAAYGAIVNGSVLISGGFDFWNNNSALSSTAPETGSVRRNLEDIYCATDQPTSGDMSCDYPAASSACMTSGLLQANSDYGGILTLPTGTGMTSAYHNWTGTYPAFAPQCSANDTTAANPVKVNVTYSSTQVQFTGTAGDTIMYTCEPVASHQ